MSSSLEVAVAVENLNVIGGDPHVGVSIPLIARTFSRPMRANIDRQVIKVIRRRHGPVTNFHQSTSSAPRRLYDVCSCPSPPPLLRLRSCASSYLSGRYFPSYHESYCRCCMDCWSDRNGHLEYHGHTTRLTSNESHWENCVGTSSEQ